jgi:putative transposase
MRGLGHSIRFCLRLPAVVGVHLPNAVDAAARFSASPPPWNVRIIRARFAPLLAEKLRAKRQGQAGSSWYVDETYLKVNGQWCYLYRAIDRDGNLVDSMLSETRDMDAAQRFFRQARVVAGQLPSRVTSDGHTSYPRAIRETLGEAVEHRCNQYLNNRLEQDHRGVKQRYYPMRGFGSFESAARFCGAFEELRQFERHRRCQERWYMS